jgi:RNA polymerase sigma-70 factor (ECF subfamily)
MSVLEVVREMHAIGRERWSHLAVSFDDFKRFCEPMTEGDAYLAKTRAYSSELYLCCACAMGNSVAQAIFKSETEDVVRSAIARVRSTGDFVEETLQEFWKKLLVGSQAKIGDYRGRGPLLAWIRISATRLAMDRSRAVRSAAEREADLGECLTEQAFGPESTLTRARFHEPFRLALQHAVTQMPKKDRNVLRMHVVGRCSIDQIGRAYNVHRATAARWLEHARESILLGVRAELEAVGLRLTDSEFRSVARIVGADLAREVSMFRSEVSGIGPQITR